MNVEEKLKVLLRELSSAISRSLSTPENMARLEALQKSGYEIYLILEASEEMAGKLNPAPIVPLPLRPEAQKPEVQKKNPIQFELSDEDKDFLRTLKIKVE
jgi:hypothetical protein